MAYSILSILHKFFFFLSTDEGILYRASVELVIFLLVTYMILSEYLREKYIEHKYLLLAFGSLALQRLIIVIIYSNLAFGDLELSKIEFFMPVLLHFLEAFALILLANAFIYTHKKNIRRIISSIERETLFLVIVAFIIEISWLNEISTTTNADFSRFYGFIVFSIIKIFTLCYPIAIILKHSDGFRYRHNLMLAFLVYAFVPILQIESILIYGSINPRIDVFLNPFPFISVMLFTKVVYLKLVNKAILKDKLRISEQKYREAKELSEMKDNFVSVVSHELRTPLTSIKLYANLLSNGKFGKVNEKQINTVNIINQETDRLTNLIEDILNLSKIESNKKEIKIERFNLYNFVKSNPLYELAREKGIRVKTNIPKDFIIDVDPEKFKQVFINLVSNAIKFTDKRGLINILAKNDMGNYIISVKDTGKGIAKDDIPRLFDKFFQVQNYMTRDKGGSGLGLAIAKHIVDMHHGNILVESELGKGSTFTVQIPKISQTT